MIWGPLRAALPAIAATAAMSMVLAGIAVGSLALWATDSGDLRDPKTGAWALGEILRLWGMLSLIALPVGFVFGVLLLSVARALTRRNGRREGT